MKKKMTALIIGTLYGCATPQDFMAEPPDAVMALAMAPEQAALCMTRNLEKKGPGFISDRRPGTAPGEWELIVRTLDTIYTVATLKPAAKGSQATIWMATVVFVSKESVIKDMTAGC